MNTNNEPAESTVDGTLKAFQSLIEGMDADTVSKLRNVKTVPLSLGRRSIVAPGEKTASSQLIYSERSHKYFNHLCSNSSIDIMDVILSEPGEK